MCLICCQPLNPQASSTPQASQLSWGTDGGEVVPGYQEQGASAGSPHMVGLPWQGRGSREVWVQTQLVACECCSRRLCLLRCQTSCGVRGALWQSPRPPTSHVSFSWEEAQGLQWSGGGRALHRGHRAVPSTVGSWDPGLSLP